MTKKYVSILNRTNTGYVEFTFAIGEPDLKVELILPESAFKEFCDANGVIFLANSSETAADQIEPERDWTWSLRDATQQRFKQNP